MNRSVPGTQSTIVSTSAYRNLGNRSKTPPIISCHIERPEKNDCSSAIAMIAAKPGG